MSVSSSSEYDRDGYKKSEYLSDETMIDVHRWGNLKEFAMKSNYKEQAWWVSAFKITINLLRRASSLQVTRKSSRTYAHSSLNAVN